MVRPPLAPLIVLALASSACAGSDAPTVASAAPSGSHASPDTTSTSSAATPGATPASTRSAIPTPTPGGSATPPQAGVVTVTVDAVARVTVDELRVRSAPGASGRELARLISGDLVWVWAGPAASEGHTWYEVGAGDLRGWVASGAEDDPWLVGAADERESALAVLRLDSCTIQCNEVVWYADPEAPSAARLVRRVVDVGLPGGQLDGERLVAGAGELLFNMLRTGLLDQSRTIEPRLLPGQVPADYADNVVRRFIRRADDGKRITVGWTIPIDARRYEPQPDADALEELARGIERLFDEVPSG